MDDIVEGIKLSRYAVRAFKEEGCKVREEKEGDTVHEDAEEIEFARDDLRVGSR